MDFSRQVLIVLVMFVCMLVVQNQAASSSNGHSDVDISKRDSVSKKSTVQTKTDTPVNKPVINKPAVSKDNSTSNGTDSGDDGFIGSLVENKDMLLRTLYVLIGVTSVVILYFVFRAWRIRGRKSKSRKYGLITTRGSDLEMAPLDADDEDDDMTVFEMNDRHK